VIARVLLSCDTTTQDKYSILLLDACTRTMDSASAANTYYSRSDESEYYVAVNTSSFQKQ
jgi:hypothetical protein